MMDRYFYTLEKGDNGKQIIHLSGNVYYNDGDETETCYRCAEWTWMFFDVDYAKQMLKDDKFFDFTDERVKYLSDLTEVQANELCGSYFNGNGGTELDITDIKEDTPCGDYWMERS